MLKELSWRKEQQQIKYNDNKGNLTFIEKIRRNKESFESNSGFFDSTKGLDAKAKYIINDTIDKMTKRFEEKADQLYYFLKEMEEEKNMYQNKYNECLEVKQQPQP